MYFKVFFVTIIFSDKWLYYLVEENLTFLWASFGKWPCLWVAMMINFDLSRTHQWISHQPELYLPQLISTKLSFFWGTLYKDKDIGGEISDFNIWQTYVEKSEISTNVEEFQLFHTTDVEKSEMLPNLEEFQNSPHDRCGEIWNLPCFLL